MKKKDKYALYLIRPDDIPENEPFFLITPQYCLLYSKKKPDKTHHEITHLNVLPELAKRWLNGCIEDLRRKYMEQNQSEILKKAKDFKTRFEQELEAERADMQTAAERGEAEREQTEP